MSTLWSLVLVLVVVSSLGQSAAAAPRHRRAAASPAPVQIQRNRAALEDADREREPPSEPEHDRGTAAPSRRSPGDVIAAESSAAVVTQRREAGWQVGLAVGADVPLDALHVGLTIHAPAGLRLSSSVGFLSHAFLGGMEAPSGGKAATALMQSALRGSVVWRTHVGIQPWSTRGFYGSVGYSQCRFSGSMTTDDALSAFTDWMLPFGLGSTPMMHMSATMHAVDLEAGWEWSLTRRFRFRTAVSLGTIVGSSTRLSIDGGPLSLLPLPSFDKLVAPLERAGEAMIDGFLKQAGPLAMLTFQLQLDLL